MQKYAGIYRAKCVKVDTDTVVANIPQVFADLNIPVGSLTGSVPSVNERGWVLFEGALANRPVWVSGGGAGTTVSAGSLTKFSVTVGDGASTSLVVTHNLHTRDVLVTVHDTGTFEELFPSVTKTTIDTVTLVFSDAPATNSIRAIVFG